MIFAIDFDGTVVEHCYPDIGKEVPHCVEVLKRIVENNHQLIIWTMRAGERLEDSKKWYAERGIPFIGANVNPTQKDWTNSPKCYAHRYIDDASVGCPLIIENLSSKIISRAYVDWKAIELLLENEGIFKK